jgi:hypothetical protein
MIAQRARVRNVQTRVVNPGDEGLWADSASDLMLSDVTEDMLAADVAPLLGVTHLAPVGAAATWPVRACLFGVFSRVMVSLVVSVPPRAPSETARAVAVVFLVDTGSPYTFLAQRTFEEFGFLDTLPRRTTLCVHGMDMTVQVSHSHFADVNVLGTDFLVRARCRLTLDFGTTRGLLDVPQPG